VAPQIHHSFHHHSHRDVTAPTGRPNLRSRLHFSHSRGGGPRSLRGHVVALGKKNVTDNRASCQSEWEVCYDEFLLSSIGYGKLHHSNFCNKSCTRTSPCVITLHRKGKKFGITGSVQYRNKLIKHVFFLDGVWLFKVRTYKATIA